MYQKLQSKDIVIWIKKKTKEV